MASGVRNLRAMFENNKESSGTSQTGSPDRGRSSSASKSIISTGTSPRPLSTVRTSFVAVERSGGQLGLQQRENGMDANGATADGGSSLEGEERGRKTTTKDGQSPPEMRKKTWLGTSGVSPTLDTAVESPIEEAEEEEKSPLHTALPVREKKSGLSAGKEADTSSKTNGSHTAKDSKPLPKPAGASTKSHTTMPAADDSSRSQDKPNGIGPTKPKPVTALNTSTTTEKKAAGVSSMKSPITPLKSPISASATNKSSATKSIKAASRTTPATKGSATKTAAPAHTATLKDKTPPHEKFHKPAPRPPTVPVALPASLTAHTASTVSKTANTSTATANASRRQSLSKASGNAQPTNSLQAHQALARSPSRSKPATQGTSKAGGLGRSSSTIQKGSSRPSFGPPPQKKTQAPRQSLPHQGVAADEGFLARMMRPTTSSASKTNDHKSAEPTPASHRSQPPREPIRKDVKAAGMKGAESGKKTTAAKIVQPLDHAKAVIREKKDAVVSAIKSPNKPPTGMAKSKEVDKTAGGPAQTAINGIEASKVPVDKAKASDAEVETVKEPDAVLADTNGANAAQATAEDQGLSKAGLTETDVSTGNQPTEEPFHVDTANAPATPTDPLSPVKLPTPIKDTVVQPISPAPATDAPIVATSEPEGEAVGDKAGDLESTHAMADTAFDEHKTAGPAISGEEAAVQDEETADDLTEETSKPQHPQVEDPEDVKAKAEIAALNAALLGDEQSKKAEDVEA